MRYFQILYWNADGKHAMTSSIAMSDAKHPRDCLKHTTEFVRSRMIQIYEVLS